MGQSTAEGAVRPNTAPSVSTGVISTEGSARLGKNVSHFPLFIIVVTPTFFFPLNPGINTCFDAIMNHLNMPRV